MRLTPLLLGAALTACAVDPTDSSIQLERLDDAKHRPAAIRALTKAYARTLDPVAAAALADRIADPLNRACEASGPSSDAVRDAVEFFERTRDRRGAACLVHAVASQSDQTSRTKSAALRAVATLRLTNASDAAWAHFLAVKPEPWSGDYRSIHDAVVALKDPRWEQEAIELLDRRVRSGRLYSPWDDRADDRYDAYRRLTAAELLGHLGTPGTTGPLLRVLLDPTRGDVAPTALTALVRIGPPVVPRAVALLRGEDRELVDYAELHNPRTNGFPNEGLDAGTSTHTATAAVVLGTLGLPEAVAPMIAALRDADPATRAVIARELTNLPPTEGSVRAFEEVLQSTSANVPLPASGDARTSLVEAAVHLFDPRLVPSIVTSALDAKPGDATEDAFRAALRSAMMLMTREQIPRVRELFDSPRRSPSGEIWTVGRFNEPEWRQALDVLNECGEDPACYLSLLARLTTSETAPSFASVKATVMLGAHGGHDARGHLVELIGRMDHTAARFLAIAVVDRLCPRGDPRIARRLQAIARDRRTLGPRRDLTTDGALRTTALRLRARAR